LENRFDNLKRIDNLPQVNSCWDYKANNLIFDKIGKPTLIDPDNAGRIPRLVDFALAIILFHNELDSAPSRLFNLEEWELFRDTYLENIELTKLEKDLWQDYLWFVFIDEALWLITCDIDLVKKNEKNDKIQVNFIKSLIKFDPKMFIL